MVDSLIMANGFDQRSVRLQCGPPWKFSLRPGQLCSAGSRFLSLEFPFGEGGSVLSPSSFLIWWAG